MGVLQYGAKGQREHSMRLIKKMQVTNNMSRDKWDMGKAYVNKIIASCDVVKMLAGYNCTQIPATESQARPLTKLTPEQQVEAWARAIETAPGGKLTVVKNVNNCEQIPATESQARPNLNNYGGRACQFLILQ